MQELHIYNQKSQTFLGTVQIADRFLTRLKGLLGTTNLASFRGLLLKPCQQVHSFGMHYPISIWFVNRELEIIRIIDELPPNHASPFIRESYLIVEFPAGWAKTTESKVGDKLEICNLTSLNYL